MRCLIRLPEKEFHSLLQNHCNSSDDIMGSFWLTRVFQMLSVWVRVQPSSVFEVPHVEACKWPELQLRTSKQGYQWCHFTEWQVPDPPPALVVRKLKGGLHLLVVRSNQLRIWCVLLCFVFKSSGEIPCKDALKQQWGKSRSCHWKFGKLDIILRADVPGSQRSCRFQRKWETEPYK